MNWKKLIGSTIVSSLVGAAAHNLQTGAPITVANYLLPALAALGIGLGNLFLRPPNQDAPPGSRG